MSTKSTYRRSARIWRLGLGGVLLAAGGTMEEGVAFAQTTTIPNPNSVIANPVPSQPLTTEWQQEQPSEMNVFQPAGEAQQPSVPQIFRFGPVILRPHADYSVTYSDGIQSSPGQERSTVIQQLSPGFALDLGSHWALDYTPTFQFYSDSHFQDTVNHSISLTGNAFYEDWVFSLVHNSEILSTPTVGTGSQTDQSSHATSLSASHPLTSACSVDLTLNQSINLVSGFEDSYDWNTMDWINYEFWPRLTAGLGIGGGYVKVDDESGASAGENLDQTYEQGQAHVSWRVTDKISFGANAGFEYRQFNTPGTSDTLDPLYGASIQYLPFRHTQISLNVSRTISSSDYYVLSQEVNATIVGLSVNQALFEKFTLNLNAGYSESDYGTALNLGVINLGVNRTDKEVTFGASIGHPFFKRGTWSIFYSCANNRSSQTGFSFASSQVGFDISYRF